jgi:type IV secretory pathway VirJ component
LIVYPRPAAGDTLFVILSGDGGWTSLDRDIGNYLSKNGNAVVGFNMLNYLWSDPTPGKGGKDLDKIISYYLAAWNLKYAVLIGYSMGADALVFTTPRLSVENTKRLRGVVLIGPAVKSQFALNFSPENNPSSTDGDLLLPHVKRISAPVLCIGGSIERESLCRRAGNNKTLPDNVHVELLQTGHTFHDGFVEICSMMSDQFKLDLNIKPKEQPQAHN